MESKTNNKYMNAGELADRIRQVEEPFRERLIQWLSKKSGQDLRDLEAGLQRWLDTLDFTDQGDFIHIAMTHMIVESICVVYGRYSE
jgi:hypothetical protein